MKKIFIVMLIVLVGAFVSIAAEVTVLWDANADKDLSGYKLYQGTSSRNYGTPIDIKCGPNNNACSTYIIKNLVDDEYFWAVTAYDKSGNESDYSNEVSLSIDSVPPGIPRNITVKINDAKKVSVSVE